MQSEVSFSGVRPSPWGRKRGAASVVASWRASESLTENFVYDTTQEPKEARYAPIPQGLHPDVVSALSARKMSQLYCHQSLAFEAVRAKKHIVVATPTASGKSLCYNLPVVDALARRPSVRALYMFPTKALARDQEHALAQLMREVGLRHPVATYDGDTPSDVRRVAKEQGGVIMTNPDMLHSGILPHHTGWARFFSALEFVIIDELHMFRGVFGSHLANVLRRLKRLATFYGSSPTFIFASATIGNAGEHASRMLGEPVAVVDDNGAPQGRRHVMVYNPPVVNPELGLRASNVKTTVKLALDLVRAEVPTLIFGQTRHAVEVMLKYLRDRLDATHIRPEQIQSYRGGYLPETRRKIEAGLRAGEILCVVATNALELGIDIGSLDAVLCAGYPGSIAGMWQRFGRGGRRGGDSVAVLITSSAPIDQFFAIAPEQLVAAPIERARIDPNNIEILVQHLKCAAFELPFQSTDSFGDLSAESISEGLNYLVEHQVVHPVEAQGVKTFHWAAQSYPANNTSLRQIGWDNFVIIERDKNKTIAEMDWRSTHTMLHEQAIYQHAGDQYQVEFLDYENRKAFVRHVEPDYYTDAMTHLKVTALDEAETSSHPWPQAENVTAHFGEISLVERIVGFKKIKYHTHENVGFGEVNLPEMQMHTTALWLEIDKRLLASLTCPRAEAIDALRGIAQSLHVVAAVGLMVDPRDLGTSVEEGDQPREQGAFAAVDPRLYLFDRMPGGVGLAERAYNEREELMLRCMRLIEGCPCQAGCPTCVGPSATGLMGTRKALAILMLKRLGIAGNIGC